jgi:hypothetical protein
MIPVADTASLNYLRHLIMCHTTSSKDKQLKLLLVSTEKQYSSCGKLYLTFIFMTLGARGSVDG